MHVALQHGPGDLRGRRVAIPHPRNKATKHNNNCCLDARMGGEVTKELLPLDSKSAPHISPGALCAACDLMAIQPGSGLPPEGISFVHEALACQPGPFPSWGIPEYSQDLLKSMQKLIKHDRCELLVKRFNSDLRFFWRKNEKVGFWCENNLFGEGTHI